MARSASTRNAGPEAWAKSSSAAPSARPPDLRQWLCAEPSPSGWKIAFLSHRVRRPTVWPIALAGRNSRAPLSLFTAQVQGREFSAGSPAPTPPGSGHNAWLREWPPAAQRRSLLGNPSNDRRRPLHGPLARDPDAGSCQWRRRQPCRSWPGWCQRRESPCSHSQLRRPRSAFGAASSGPVRNDGRDSSDFPLPETEWCAQSSSSQA